MPEDNDLDEWDQRIADTGCFQENEALQLCHADTNDWRKCLNEMKAFTECWKVHGNASRVQTRDFGSSNIKLTED